MDYESENLATAIAKLAEKITDPDGMQLLAQVKRLTLGRERVAPEIVELIEFVAHGLCPDMHPEQEAKGRAILKKLQSDTQS